MQEIIYLVASRSKVERMTKNLPELKRGEIPIRVSVTIEPDAFRVPVIEKEIYIEDWREGVDMGDIDFEGRAITKEEAQTIRELRLEKMREILSNNGYTIEKNEGEDD